MILNPHPAFGHLLPQQGEGTTFSLSLMRERAGVRVHTKCSMSHDPSSIIYVRCRGPYDPLKALTPVRATSIEHRGRSMDHGSWLRRVGVRVYVVSLRQCADLFFKLLKRRYMAKKVQTEKTFGYRLIRQLMTENFKILDGNTQGAELGNAYQRDVMHIGWPKSTAHAFSNHQSCTR